MGNTIDGDEVHGNKVVLSGEFPNAQITIDAGRPMPSPAEMAALLAEHRAWVLDDTARVELRGVPLPQTVDGRRIALDLPLGRVYVRLRVVREERRRGEEDEVRRALATAAEPDDYYLRLVDQLGEHLYARQMDERAAPEPVDAEEALRRHGRLVVLGSPGAGKSTLLRYLAQRAAADPDGPLPLPVALGRYAAQLSRSDVALVDFALEGIPERRRTALRAAVNSGRVLWLLDALDEAREAAPRVLAQLSDLPGQLVLTSRPLGYVLGPAAGLAHYELLPLDTGDIAQFLNNWFGALAEAQGVGSDWAAEQVRATQVRLAGRPGLRVLLGNPLLLTFVAVLAGKDPAEALPKHRAGLYRRYVEELLESWEGVRRGRTGAAELPVGPLRGEAAREALRDGVAWLGWWLHLAYYGGRSDRSPLRVQAIRALVGYFRAAEDYADLRRHEALAVAGDVVAFWREAGLLDVWPLRTDDGLVDFLAFRHLTFQEYGAAVVLAQAWGIRRAGAGRERAWAFLRPRLHVRAWREPLLLLGGLLGPAAGDDLLGRVLAAGSPHEAVLRWDLRRAVALAGEGKGRDGPGHAALAEQLSAAIRSEAWALIHALQPLVPFFRPTTGQSASPAWAATIESALLAALSGERQPGRRFAIQALGETGNTAAVPELLAALEDEDRGIRVPAIEALGQIGGAAAEAALLAALRREDFFVRTTVQRALSQIGSAAVVDGLLAALQDEDEEVRDSAASSLSEIGGPAVIDGLLKAMRGDAADIHRAATALCLIGGPAVVDGLLRLLGDEDSNVRRDAVWALGQTAGAAVADRLLRALEDEDGAVRQAAAGALGRIGGVAAMNGLLRALGHEDANVRRAAAGALNEIGDVAAVPGLLAALGDEDDGVRRAATATLGRIGDVAAVPALLAALEDDNDAIRRATIEALGQIGDAAAVPGLLAALEGADGDSRRATIAALGQIGDAAAAPGLLAALEGADGDSRRATIAALGQISDAAAVPALLAALEDADEWVQWEAIRALGRIGDAAAVPRLQVALADEKTNIRWIAGEALGAIGDATAAAGLLSARDDEDPAIRGIAALTLVELGEVAAVPRLLEALRDEEWDGGEAADEALARMAPLLAREPLAAAVDMLAHDALADPKHFAEPAFWVLEEFTARLAALDAAALPDDDLLLPPEPPVAELP